MWASFCGQPSFSESTSQIGTLFGGFASSWRAFSLGVFRYIKNVCVDALKQRVSDSSSLGVFCGESGSLIPIGGLNS